MLFSADWDLNVGGIAYAGSLGSFDWRAAYVRLVEGAALVNTIKKDQDEHFFVLDLNTKVANVDTGLHFYGAYGKVCLEADCNATPIFQTLNQTWIGAHATAKLDPINLHGVVLYNNGKIGNTSNDGFLVRLEPSTKLGNIGVSLLGIYSSGKSDGRGFTTVHSILGTGGYWAYTHIFTPNGPSDVNDFLLEPGNKGYGLMTLQAKLDVPITEKLSAQFVAGTFRSVKDMLNGNRNNVGKNLGNEFGAQLTAKVGKYMNLEFGAAVAKLGNAGKAIYQGNDKSTVNEIFARLQLEF